MESELTLANKGDKKVSLKTTGTSMRCTVLFGATQNGKKLTPLIVFKGQPNGRIAKTFNRMPASMNVCQEKAWVDQRVFKHWIELLLSPQAKVAALSLWLGPENPPANQALLTAVTTLLNQSLSHLPALIEQHIHATLQSPSFSATVTTSIQTELLSLQPPCSRISQESGSESK